MMCSSHVYELVPPPTKAGYGTPYPNGSLDTREIFRTATHYVRKISQDSSLEIFCICGTIEVFRVSSWSVTHV